MTDQTLDAMDALLDGTLDDLADIPEFRTYPIGAHKVKMSWNLSKTIQGVFKDRDDEKSGLKNFIELYTEAIETVELPAGSTDTPLDKGAVAQFLFDLSNEFAQGQFKSVLSALSAHYGPMTNRELLAASNGAEVVIVIKHRKNKKDADKPYAQIDSLLVV